MWVYYTTSCNIQPSAPEYGRDHHPKHVELIGIINKSLLLHLVGIYIIYSHRCRRPSTSRLSIEIVTVLLLEFRQLWSVKPCTQLCSY